MKKKIKFGYEVGTGEEVSINMAHTVITGLTQEAGKTTAIMGMIKRSELKTIIMKTKIGEKAITEGALIPPFYKEDFDWEYASELLESSRKEKLKFERSWIIKYSKNATNLLEFKRNIDDALTNEKMRELEKSVLITLQAYLEKILPELQYAPLSKSLDIRDGANIMDLERFKEETQGLIIKSVLDEVLTKEKKTWVIIPESWKYIPEQYASPVKRPAQSFIRQGATNDNFLGIDSQDITGVAKVILKQISNWILGKQTEINEIKRTLDQIPLSKKLKPKPEDIANLKLGEFFVVTSEGTIKAYAQPSWLDDESARKVALGELRVEDLQQPTHIAPYQIFAKEQEIEPQQNGTLIDFKKPLNELRDDFISNRNDFFDKFQQINESISAIQRELFKIKNEKVEVDEDEIVMRVLQKLPTPTNSNVNSVTLDEEALISKVLARVTSGEMKVYEVLPLEKIKKDFLEEAKNKIIKEIEQLSEKAKRLLKYLETRGVGVAVNELVEKCFHHNSKGGVYNKEVNDTVGELKEINVGYKHSNGKCHGRLKLRIKDLLGVHEATEQEIEQVYSHILMEMLKC